MTRKPDRPLRTGFTTGACAAAAAQGAARRLWTGVWAERARIRLPKGETPEFPLVDRAQGEGWAEAGVVKDAGDDPDVTHGVTVRARLGAGAPGAGLVFRAGEGVGRVTRPGLPLGVGEPAINPGPRALIAATLEDLAESLEVAEPLDLEVAISIPGGAEIAERTWNPRLGILDGLSILGTTGIVKPYSCAAWIASIHRGVDVARAAGLAHAVAATGSTSERAAIALYDPPPHALLDMGDFAGGLLKYLRARPIPRLTIAGGFAKLSKLGQGALDLHSGRSQVDFAALGAWAREAGCDAASAVAVESANTAMAALEVAGPRLAAEAARRAKAQALDTLAGAPVDVEVLVVDRAGAIVARDGFER